MKHVLFSMAGCEKCEEMQEILTNKGIEFEHKDFDEDIAEFREIYRQNKELFPRNEDGSLPIPSLILYDEQGNISKVTNKKEDIL